MAVLQNPPIAVPPSDVVEAVSGTGGMQRSYEAQASPASQRRHQYIGPRSKFTIAVVFGFGWLSFSIWVSLPWLHDLSDIIPPAAAVIIVSLLAFVPGFIVAFLAASLLLDRQPPFKILQPTTPITVVIAARNEEAGIAETMRYLAAQDYDGPLTVLLVDNGSTDGTVQIARTTPPEWGLSLRIIS